MSPQCSETEEIGSPRVTSNADGCRGCRQRVRSGRSRNPVTWKRIRGCCTSLIKRGDVSYCVSRYGRMPRPVDNVGGRAACQVISSHFCDDACCACTTTHNSPPSRCRYRTTARRLLDPIHPHTSPRPAWSPHVASTCLDPGAPPVTLGVIPGVTPAYRPCLRWCQGQCRMLQEK